jgi:predicted NBD/HSP70 family sugar kinase
VYGPRPSRSRTSPASAATKLAQEAFGPAVDAHRLVRLANEGEPEAIGILDGIGRHLGAGIGSLVNIFNPSSS